MPHPIRRTRKALVLSGLICMVTLQAFADQTLPSARLASTGTLRVGLVEGQSAGPVFVVRDRNGTPEGPTVDLGASLSRHAGLPVAYTVFSNSGAVAQAIQDGTVDVGFMPVDATRSQVLDFGPGYYDLESTYLVSGASGITDVAGVDRPDLRVLAIAGTATLRAAAGSLKQTQPTAVPSVAEAVERMRTGQADAFALSRDTLQPILPRVPDARIVTGTFQRTQVAPAIPKGRPAALDQVTAWLTEAKRSGLVRRIFDAHGLQQEAVAP